MPLLPHNPDDIFEYRDDFLTSKFMYGHPANICCDKNSEICKTKVTVNMFIIQGYVNNYGKNRYL